MSAAKQVPVAKNTLFYRSSQLPPADEEILDSVSYYVQQLRTLNKGESLQFVGLAWTAFVTGIKEKNTSRTHQLVIRSPSNYCLLLCLTL